jgi:hypothetical protein
MVDKQKLQDIKNKAAKEMNTPQNKGVFRGIRFMFTLVGLLVFIMLLIFLFSQELTGRNIKGWAQDLTKDPQQDRKIKQLSQTLAFLESKINSVEASAANTPIVESIDQEAIKETINSELSSMGQNLLKTQQLSRHFALTVYLFQRIETAFYLGIPFNQLFLQLVEILPEKIQSHPIMANLGKISTVGVPTLSEIKLGLKEIHNESPENFSFFKQPLSYLKSLITVRRSNKDPELQKIINALDKQNLKEASEIIRLSSRSYDPAAQDLYRRIEAIHNLQELSRITLAYLSGRDL